MLGELGSILLGAVLAIVLEHLFRDRLTYVLLRPFRFLLNVRRRTLLLDGIWHSTYQYKSRGSAGLKVSEHYLVIRQIGERLRVTSLPVREGSIIAMDLVVVDERYATGSWHERTSTDRLVHGAIHLLVQSPADTLTGRWLGHTGDDRLIKFGDWNLKRISRSTRRKDRQKYSMVV